MLANPYPETKVLFLEVGSGKPDAYKNLIEKKQLPAAVNHTPGFVVELPAIANGARAVIATLVAFFNQPL
jgi:hippurate hydrolase